MLAGGVGGVLLWVPRTSLPAVRQLELWVGIWSPQGWGVMFLIAHRFIAIIFMVIKLSLPKTVFMDFIGI